VGKGAFTTLTTSTRALDLYGSKVLISDTVGFISRLPTYMIESFKSTLEELNYASLVLLVLDSSEPLSDFINKYQSCVNIMAELQVSPSRVILVFNKSDLVSEDELERKMRAIAAIKEKCAIVSATLGWGIDQLKLIIREAVLEYTESTITFTQEDLKNLSQHLDWLRMYAVVNITTNSDGTATALVKGPLWAVDRFKAQVE
jgi:50S ribosomal subunit-associated GTPase HflX